MRHAWQAALALSLALVPVLRADGPPSAEPLAAEVQAVRDLNFPSEPIAVRFLLHNTSAQVVELPLATAIPADAPAALPMELILGTPETPAVSIVYQDDKPVDIKPGAAPAAGGEGLRVLRIAPHASVGLEVDLREVYKPIRYAGAYRIEWKPLGGRLAASAALRVDTRRDAFMITDFGRLQFELLYETAPHNVENFLDLVRSGFYNQKTFHRVVPNFLIQGGCPKGDGTGIRPDGKLIAGEFTKTPIEPGMLLMARKPSEPNSASCQFIIALARLPQLDGQYTIIGRARGDESLQTLQMISAQPTDKRDRPVRAIRITTISLIDAEESTPRSLSQASQPVAGGAKSPEAIAP